LLTVLPRHTTSSLSQASIHNAGNIKSRISTASGMRHEKCHPAQRAVSASAPIHIASSSAMAAATLAPRLIAAYAPATRGRTQPVKISGTNSIGKVIRRSRAQRTCRAQTSATSRRASGCLNGLPMTCALRPDARTSFVVAASSATSAPSARTPPQASSVSRRNSMFLPCAKPKPNVSLTYSQRAWNVLRKAHSSSAQKFAGCEAIGTDTTTPLSGRQRASSRWM
jgi:hypothetical protein